MGDGKGNSWGHLTELAFLSHQCQPEAHSPIVLEMSGTWQQAQNSNAAHLTIYVKILPERELPVYFSKAVLRLRLSRVFVLGPWHLCLTTELSLENSNVYTC